MKKTKFTKYLLTFAIVATAIVGVQGYTPKAEEQTEEVVATDTDAEAVVAADELTAVESRKDTPHYSLSNGGTWDGTHYVLNGTTVYDAFFYDGEYTYYLQFDGTPMKNRLTYHPDGEHIIYFDENGHEVFSDFAMVKQSIAGEPVDDMCFFDVYGHMYVNTLTYDKTGTKIYYINEYGVIERNGWFEFPDDGVYYFNEGYVKDITRETEDMIMHSRCGYANADGTLMTSQFTYNWLNWLVYIGSDGMTPDYSEYDGLIEIDGICYMIGTYGKVLSVAQYSEESETYSATEELYEEYVIYTFDGQTKKLIDLHWYSDDGKLIAVEEYRYDDNGNMINDNYYLYTQAFDGGEICDDVQVYSYTTYFYDDYGRMIYKVYDGHRVMERYENIHEESSYEYYDSGRLKYYSTFAMNSNTNTVWYSDERFFENAGENHVTCKRASYHDENGNVYMTYERGYINGVLYAETIIEYDTNTGAEISREVYDAAGNRIG